MINEFYAALLNESARNTAVGHDYVDPMWSTRFTGADVAVVRQTLLGPRAAYASHNWRAIELRKLVDRGDLYSIMTQIDARTGYQPHKLLESMTSLFKPRTLGTLATTVKGKFRATDYGYYTWTIETDGSNATLSYDDKQVVTPLGGDATLRIDLPGTDGFARIENATNRFTSISWAAVPSRTIADVATDLKTSVRPQLKALSRMKSVIDSSDCLMLGNLPDTAEDPIIVAAATLLVIGHTLAS